MGMLRAMVRFNVTPGKRLNNPPSDDSAFEVHLRFDSEAECVAYADMRPWPNRPVQQTIPLGSENFQLHIVEVALQQFVKECSGTRRRPSAAIKRTGADLGDESRSRAWHVDRGLDRSKLGASFRAPSPITLQSAAGVLGRGSYARSVWVPLSSGCHWMYGLCMATTIFVLRKSMR